MMAYTGRLRPKSPGVHMFVRGGSARNPREALNKCLYGEAPPRDATPYPSKKRSIFVTDSYFFDSASFQQFKGIQSSKQGM